MKQLHVSLLFFSVCFFSHNALSIRMILVNRTKKKIRLKYYGHTVSATEAEKQDLEDKDVFIIPNADTRYRIAWAYVHRFETQKAMFGYQYRGKDIFLETENDYLFIIVGHGENRSNYNEILLTPEEATTYVTHIHKINKIKKEVKEFNKHIKANFSSFFGDPFNYYLESLLLKEKREIETLSIKIRTWLTELQTTKRVLDEQKTKLHGYGDKTLATIKEMDSKLAAFLESKPKINPSSYEYTSQVKFPTKYSAAAHVIATEEKGAAEPKKQPEETLEKSASDIQAQLEAQQEIKKLMEEQEA